MALISAITTLFSDLIRLKRRKTRKARIIFRLPSGLPSGMMPDMSSMPTATTMKSKLFHPLAQNFLYGPPQLHALSMISNTAGRGGEEQGRGEGEDGV